MPPICILDNVSKSYWVGEGEEVSVLRGVSLTVEEGELTAIMGASGSGKTTLMNIIGCLDVPTSGTYMLAGRDVSKLSDDELSAVRNELIGFVFQSFHLIPYASVIENVMLPTIYLEKTSGDLRERAMELLGQVGLADRAKFRPSQLSGGQQQRVAIARALINNPRLILADEPTGQLDSKTSGEIMEILKSLNEAGRTVVVITHEEVVASAARRIIRIKDGVME